MDSTTILQVSEWLGAAAITTLVSISPRFKRKPLIFEYPRREGLIAAMLYGSILAVSFIFYWKNPAVSEPLPALTQSLTLAGIITLPFIAALALRRQPPLSAGIGRSNFNHSIRLAVVLVILTIFLRGKIFSLLHGVSSQQGFSLVLLLALCALEESVFRGYIQSRLTSWLGTVPGVILCSILSTVMLVPRFLAAPELLYVILAKALVQNLVSGYIMLKSGHVSAPAIYRAFSEWMYFLG